MTIGQLSFYDQIKIILLESGYFKDNPITHIISSIFAVSKYYLYIIILILKKIISKFKYSIIIKQ